MAKLTINIASVKVMRFQHVDNLRKNAARLADKAVAQYKVAKRAQQSEEGYSMVNQTQRRKATGIRAC